VHRFALAACSALLTALALAPAAQARSLAPGLSKRTAEDVVGLAKAHWPALESCSSVRVLKVSRRVMRRSAAADRRLSCTLLLRRGIRLSAKGWCRALKPAFQRMARGGRRSAIPYDCSVIIGRRPKRYKLPRVRGLSPSVVKQVYKVASSHWPRSHCRAREQVRLASNAQLVAQSATGAPSGDTFIAGQARLRDRLCITWLNADVPAWPAVDLCITLAHEFGHLTGLEHSSDPDDLMAPIDARSARCEAAFAAPAVPLPEQPVHPAPVPDTPVVVAPAGFGGI
jgi:Matrixin